MWAATRSAHQRRLHVCLCVCVVFSGMSWTGLRPALAVSPSAASGVEIQTLPDSPNSKTVSGVTVVAPRQATVRNFIWKVGQTADGLQLARTSEVCPAVLGLPPSMGDFVSSSIKSTGVDAGAKAGKAHCSANILVYFTDKPKELLAGLRRRMPQMFGDVSPAEFPASAKRPIFWAHNVQFKAADGSPLKSYCYSQGGQNTACAMEISHVQPSALQTPAVAEISNSLVIVDTNRVAGFQLGALSGYIAMVALAQFQPGDPVTDMPTILSLFADKEHRTESPAALTSWDRAYLKALYSTHPDATAEGQRSEIFEAIRRGPGFRDHSD